jgi:hypothetical protein
MFVLNLNFIFLDKWHHHYYIFIFYHSIFYGCNCVGSIKLCIIPASYFVLLFKKKYDDRISGFRNDWHLRYSHIVLFNIYAVSRQNRKSKKANVKIATAK